MKQFPSSLLNYMSQTLGLFLVLTTFCFGGQLKDSRDGHIYKTEKVGKKEWMVENLNFATRESFCYEGSNCEKFGRYYRWNEALNVCPEGWHLPAKGELDALLKNGPRFILDPNGFAMQSTGNFGGQDDIPYHEEDSYLWSSTSVDECDGGGEIDCSYTYVLRSSHFGISVVEEYFDAVVLYSVRCVKD